MGLEAGANVTEFQDDGRSVHVSCADGRAFDGAAAIGADGLRSRARALFSDDEADLLRIRRLPRCRPDGAGRPARRPA